MILQKCSLWNVAGVFFLEPTKDHFIKEISRKINLAHTSVNKHVSELMKEGFIKKVKSEIYPAYLANRDNPEFIFYKKIFNIISLRNSGIIDLISEKNPRSIIVYGSYGKGEDTETSDIDLFIDSKIFKIDLEKYEKKLNRRMHIIFKGEENKSLMSSISQGTLLFGEKNG
ncbi:nucleotidyltransferase domain-containing protein [Candidatus Pacearchaeota archaeon]|nr:nucleotidyltransferase domain-containing protein [Candidatus Pacearchaeota archaeon]